MTRYMKVLGVVVVGTAFAFASSVRIWPPPSTFTPPPSLLPFFIGLSLVESVAFGAGVAFLIFGWRLVRETGVGPVAAWGGYLGIGWSLINWWAHDGFHRVNGLNLEGLVRIDYGFHVTLILGTLLTGYFFLSVARMSHADAAHR